MRCVAKGLLGILISSTESVIVGHAEQGTPNVVSSPPERAMAALLLSFNPMAAAYRRSVAPAARSTVNMQLEMPDFMKNMKMPGQKDDGDVSEEEGKEMEKRMKTGDMTFDDFLKQIDMMQKAGNMQAMLKKVPGMGGQISDEQLRTGEAKLKRYKAFTKLMSTEERADPQILIDEVMELKNGNPKPERLQRIADEAGEEVLQVGEFVAEFIQLRTASQKFANGASPEDIKREMMADQQKAGNVKLNRAQRRAQKKQKAKR